MTDSDVGIVWGARDELPGVVTDLIRKLVEERCDKYKRMDAMRAGIFATRDHAYFLELTNRVLSEFGIDPATWGMK